MGISGNSTVLPNQINRLSGFKGSFRNAVGRINLFIVSKILDDGHFLREKVALKKKISTVF